MMTTTTIKTPAETALSGLYEAAEFGDSAAGSLHTDSKILAQQQDEDGQMSIEDIRAARIVALDLVEAAQAAGQHLRTLERLAAGEPCS